MYDWIDRGLLMIDPAGSKQVQVAFQVPRDRPCLIALAAIDMSE
jgi:hypothetical protein